MMPTSSSVLHSIMLFLLTLLVPLSHAWVFATEPPPRYIDVQGQDVWISGSNVAWVDFARDFGPGGIALSEFEVAFSEMRANGGNSFRVWMHTTGTHTPVWSDGLVSGPGPQALSNLKQLLDLAESYDLVLLLSLWSFDMLRATNPEEVLQRNHALLTDETIRASYIEHSLIPMVEAVKGHKAIMAWEIFNEAEGMSQEFGWSSITTNHVPMADIQSFVNQTAGAIRRTDPDAKVTTGIVSFDQVTDIYQATDPQRRNYYRDDRLRQAGGDQDGILDFYTVHYYGHGDSPFSRRVEYFEVDKPVVISEFFINADVEGVSKERVYKRFYDNGYAGAMSWQWVDWRQNRNNNESTWINTLPNLQYMYNHHRDEVTLSFSDRPPDIQFGASETSIEATYATELNWQVRGAAQVSLGDSLVMPMGSHTVSPLETTTYILHVEHEDQTVQQVPLTITVIPRLEVNRIVEEYTLSDVAGLWIEYDMDAAYQVISVHVDFESVQADSLMLYGSFDGINFSPITDFSPHPTEHSHITLPEPTDTRFVRISSEEPFAVSHAEVYGLPSEVQPPVLRIITPEDGATLPQGTQLTIEADARRGSGTFSGVYFHINGEQQLWRRFRPYRYTHEFSEPGTYVIEIEVRESNFSNFFSKPATVRVPAPSELTRYEVRLAELSGGPTLQTGSGASDGQYIVMTDEGTITWNNLHVERSGTFTARIGYNLPFDYKEQFLYVNGVRVDTVAFSTPINQWRFTDVDVELDQGPNSLTIGAFWGWMWIDYLELIGEGVGTSARPGESDAEIPATHRLLANYPNPFNPQTILPYELAHPTEVRVDVFDLTGRLVNRMTQGRQPAGRHEVVFDARGLASGVYMYRLHTDTAVLTGNMMLVR